MQQTKLTYFNLPVFVDKKNFLWYYEQDNDYNVKKYILWENAPLIKGDNLLEMFTELDSKITYEDGKIKVNKNYIKKIINQ